MAELVYRGMTTRNIYRCMSSAPFPGVTVLDSSGNLLKRITVNGETAVLCEGIRDGSVPRGLAGGGYQNPDKAPLFPGMDPGDVSPTWAPSQWEQP